MAVLHSEDNESPSRLEIEVGKKEELYKQIWQRFALVLSSGDQTLMLGKSDSAPEREACMFCREPNDEVKALLVQFEELASNKRDRVLFEPAEPSFELDIARSGSEGLTVHVWLDAGNAKTGIYRWDAAGIRFFTTQAHLNTFVEQLKQEFAC